MTASDADAHRPTPTPPALRAVRASPATAAAPATLAAGVARSPIDVATRAFDAGLLVDVAGVGPLAALDLAGGAVRLDVVDATIFLAREPLAAGALGDGCAERRVRGERDASPAARDAERARAVREAAALKRELERLDG